MLPQVEPVRSPARFAVVPCPQVLWGVVQITIRWISSSRARSRFMPPTDGFDEPVLMRCRGECGSSPDVDQRIEAVAHRRRQTLGYALRQLGRPAPTRPEWAVTRSAAGGPGGRLEPQPPPIFGESRTLVVVRQRLWLARRAAPPPPSSC